MQAQKLALGIGAGLAVSLVAAGSGVLARDGARAVIPQAPAVLNAVRGDIPRIQSELGYAYRTEIMNAGTAAHAVAAWVKPPPRPAVIVKGRALAVFPLIGIVTLRITNTTSRALRLTASDFSVVTPGAEYQPGQVGIGKDNPAGLLSHYNQVRALSIPPHTGENVELLYTTGALATKVTVHWGIDGLKGAVRAPLERAERPRKDKLA